MKRQSIFIVTLFLLAQFAITGCNALVQPFNSPQNTETTKTALVQAKEQSTPPLNLVSSPVAADNSLAAIETALETIYSQVSPEVVNIQVTEKTTLTQQNAPDLPPGFRFFFGSPSGQSQQPQQFFRHGAGSGFVWDTQGHIITNNHVIAQADTIDVVFSDGTTVPATVVGTDPESDLAVIKVDVPASKLQPVTLADSTKVKVGQIAVAIGNPFGLEGTMTVGIVSALGRSLPVSTPVQEGLPQGPIYTIPEIIQTDAPINPGNSGGVLVNDQGEVIGVTAAIESPVRASAGIGFVIPSAIVNKVAPELIANGHYEHPWLGVSGTSLNPALATAMNLNSSQRGALVVEVTPGGPADQAGLHGSDRQVTIEGQSVQVGGDVITAINGQPVKTFEDVAAYLFDSGKVGQKVTLTVLRQGKEEQLTITLGARPQPGTVPGQAEGSTAGQAWLGVSGLTLTPAIAQAMNLPNTQKGVLIEQVELGSPADQAGLHGSFKPAIISGHQIAVGGDVITAIDGQPINQIQELQTFIQQAQPDQQISLSVLRNGEQVDVSVTLGTRPQASMP